MDINDIKEIEGSLKNKFNSEISIEKINSYGEVSNIFKILTKDQKYILKTNNLSTYENYLKEKWCSDKCKVMGIETPKIILVDKTQSFAYVVLEYIQGINCIEIKNDNLKNKIYKHLGILSRNISTISPDKNLGDLKNLQDSKKWFYEDYLNYEINQTQNKEDYLDLTLNQRETILKTLYVLKNTSFEFCLCHGDLSLKNALYIQAENKIILLDFGSAETQPKFYFEIMLKWLELNYENSISIENFNSFVHGLIGDSYIEWLNQNKNIIKDLALLYVLDKYRWAHDKSAKDWQEKYLNRLYKVLDLMN